MISKSEKITILHIAVPSPLWQSFDYLLPPECDVAALQPGIRVEVPFGRRQLVGILLSVSDSSTFDLKKLKAAITVIDQQPILSATVFALCRWASDYYHFPLGEVMSGTLPKMLSKGRQFPANIVAKDWVVAEPDSPVELNAEQQLAVDAICAADGFDTFLLDGITGSGKTEVYLRAIAHVLKQGKQALVLVPEIGLTPQTVARFEQIFDVPIVKLHSNLTDKQRAVAWMKAHHGEARIIIGTRSSIFVALPDPGIIILDEEHDLSFKQQAGFRYSARDCAVMRGYLEKVPVVLGSATPSLETLYNAQRGRYQHLKLTERAGKAVPPVVSCINLCGQSMKGGLSPVLLKAIGAHLKNGGQVLLFLNRRGYAPVLMCHSCGWMVMCPFCDARMTLHYQPERLHCHHCDRAEKPPRICQQCHQSEMVPVGLGTERIEQTLATYFPNQVVIRIDRDNTTKKGQLEALLKQVHNQEADIIVGTQMVAKGHHFEKLTLVAIIDADGGLFSVDFRALERMAQMIVQVSGRAGREERVGQVLIQTHHPEHPLLQLLLKEGFSAFSEAVLRERKSIGLPPYSYLAILRAEGDQRQHPREFLEQAKRLLPTVAQVTVLGPVSAPMEKRAGRFRAQLLIQSCNRQTLRQVVSPLRELSKLKKPRNLRWNLDIDPQDLL